MRTSTNERTSGNGAVAYFVYFAVKAFPSVASETSC
jgi:hypothetical protein